MLEAGVSLNDAAVVSSEFDKLLSSKRSSRDSRQSMTLGFAKSQMETVRCVNTGREARHRRHSMARASTLVLVAESRRFGIMHKAVHPARAHHL